ncbi:MAG: tetratricopeptide repeat-containing sensor histidine kinase [Bacteroidales bacterium]|nr:tetratricopeptide repeat-containing sensor histidine kinase [Bacteroidales bacterium]
MKRSVKLILFGILTFLSVGATGQITLFPECNKYPPFEGFRDYFLLGSFDLSTKMLAESDFDGFYDCINILLDVSYPDMPLNKGIIDNYKGIYYYYTNENGLALAHYLNALNHFTSANYYNGFSHVLNNIAVIFYEIEDYESIIKYLKKAIEFSSEESATNRAIYIINLAEAEAATGNYKEALALTTELYHNFDPAKVDFSIIAIIGIIIKSYNSLGDTENAGEWIEKGRGELTDSINYIDKLSLCIPAMKYYLDSKNYEEVLVLGNSIYPAEKESYMADLGEVVSYMAASYTALEDFRMAAKYNSIADSLEYNRSSADRNDLIAPLLAEYAFNRDQIINRTIEKEINENNQKEIAQRRFIIYLFIVLTLFSVLIMILHRTRKLKNKLRDQLSVETKKLTAVNRKINQKNREIEKENRLLDTLISVFAHDLINPFQAILGFSQLIITDYEILKLSDIREYSSLLSDTSFQLNQLLVNLKNMAIVQDDSRKLESETFIVYPVINDIITLFKPSAKKKKIIIKSETDNDVSVYINPDLLRSVLRNLISNAVKFSNPGSSIDVQLKSNSNIVQISVTDYGIGMKEEIREKLLKRQYLMSATGTSNEKGSGLGLAICIELLEIGNGSLDIQSTVNKGTKITINIPVKK